MPWPAKAAGAAIILSLSACGGGPDEAGHRIAPVRAGSTVSDVPVKIGQPYRVGRKTYIPQDAPAYDEVGYASWYGEEHEGDSTANGESFVPGGISAAHPTLPLPSYVEVTALDTGRTILVRINDRGPFSSARLIDLSRGAAEQLGIIGHGAAPVRVRRVYPPEQERGLLRAHRRAPARAASPERELERLRKKLSGLSDARSAPSSRQAQDEQLLVRPWPPSRAIPDGNGYAVQVAAFASRERAERLAHMLDAAVIEAGGVWRVRLGPYRDQPSARRGVALAASKGFSDANIMAIEAP
ncbi:septal ring lytic transglycosylase RlpA family protein [Sphingobium sp. AN641]|uniref:septal ring lytic transglycosylase RlpA family protein n=1 Tax=Sphingobium sp. AN641 TaxID=3133443 RepID=UPI0030BF990D